MLFIMACVLTAGLTFQSCTSNDQKIRNDLQKTVANDYRTISYSVNDGVVTLAGVVETQQAKSSAESAARNIAHVKSVHNNIMVENTTNSNMYQNVMYSDETMRNSLKTRLNTDGFYDVNVDVNNGEVTLSGDLKRDELTRVMQIANEQNPRRVINNMTLR